MAECDGYYTMKRVGKIIRLEREKKKLKQKELAEKAGINNCSLNRFEKGLKVAKLSTLEKIAAAMGMRIEVSLVEEKRT